jgi:alcohol dehydrogenase
VPGSGLGTGFSALRKAGAGPGTTVLIDGISGTLGLGACLIALGLGVTRILGTGRNATLLKRAGSRCCPSEPDPSPTGPVNSPTGEWTS